MSDRIDETAPAAPGEQLHEFVLLGVIGTGAMGTVYRARQISLDREVAVKVLHAHLAATPSFVERFRREAHALGRLRHPTLVAGIAAGRAQGHEYLAMELVDGESLDRLIAARGRIELAEALSIAIQTGRALEYAHEKGLVHRDLKPPPLTTQRRTRCPYE